MVYAKRLTATTALGAVAGVMCWYGGQSIGIVYTPGLIAGTILNRTFIGVVIGISALRWPYPLHGTVLGFLGSIPLAMSSNDARAAIMFVMYGALWGLLIELITTKALKLPQRAA